MSFAYIAKLFGCTVADVKYLSKIFKGSREKVYASLWSRGFRKIK